MSLITWSETLSVNIKTIDSQHKKLVDLLNEFNNAILAQKANEVLGKTLKGLIDYTKTHFSEEERLMKTHQYSTFDSHKKEHEALIAKVMTIQKKFEEGMPLPVQTLVFLKDWLQNHIMVTDKQYAPFLKQKGVQ